MRLRQLAFFIILGTIVVFSKNIVADDYRAQHIIMDDVIYFVADDGVSGSELWRSDGTQEGTFLVKDILKEKNERHIIDIKKINNSIYFTGKENISSYAVWKSDGTSEGTVIFKSGNSKYTDLISINKNLFFTSEPEPGSGGYLDDLWFANTSVEGSVAINKIGLCLGALAKLNGNLIYMRDNELWRSNGTIVGTYKLKKVFENIHHMVSMNGKVFLRAWNKAWDDSLWVTNGTKKGTVNISDVIPLMNTNNLFSSTENGPWFFCGITPETGAEIWKSDGTKQGTSIIKDIQPGKKSSMSFYPSYAVTCFNRTAYFFADDGINGIALWKTDGSEDGTVMIKGLSSGSLYTTRLGNYLFFTTDDGLYRSNGTTQGTIKLNNLQIRGPLISMDDKIYFFGKTDKNPYGLWCSGGLPQDQIEVKSSLYNDYYGM